MKTEYSYPVKLELDMLDERTGLYEKVCSINISHKLRFCERMEDLVLRYSLHNNRDYRIYMVVKSHVHKILKKDNDTLETTT
jgi:hypothetical protein